MRIGRVLGWVVSAGVAWSGVAQAQGLELTRAPLQGGDIADLAYDPNTSGLVYAAVAGPGLYVSKDGGLSFREQPLPGAFRHEPRVVLPSRSDQGLLLVCEPSENGVLRSEDGGKTFTRVLVIKDLGCTALIEGNTPGSYYATSYSREAITLHTSQDSGKTWSPQLLKWSTQQSVFDQELKVSVLTQLPSGRLVFGLADRAPSFTVGNRGRLAYCDDGTTLVDSKSATQAVQTLSSNGAQLLAFSDDVGDPDLWSSPDGATWTRNTFAFGSSSYSPYLALEYVASRDVFLALGRDRLLQSAAAAYTFDGGKPLNRFFGMARWRSLAADPLAATTWLLGTERAGEGVFRRNSPTTTDWTLASGIESANVDVAYRDAESGYVYAASLTGGRVWAGASGARSLRVVFRNRDLPYDGAMLTGLAPDHADPKHLVLALRRKADFMELPELWELGDITTAPVPKPGDFDQTWVKAADPMTPIDGLSISALFVDGALRLVGFQPKVADTAVAQYLYRSVDGGQSYAPLSLQTAGPIWFIARDPHDLHVFYLAAGADDSTVDATAQGLFRSTNGGDTWTPLGPLPNIGGYYPRYIAFDPDDAKRFWVASTLRVWQTLDGGASFTEIDVPGNDSLLGLAYSAPRKRVLLAQASGLLEREVTDAASWASAAKLSGTPISLLADGSGVATDVGLFVIADILGGDTPGSAGAAGGATEGSGGNGSGGASSPAGGSASSGGRSVSTSAGASADGAGTSSAQDSSRDSSGCSCHLARGSRQSATFAGSALALGLLGRRRARRLQ
ncbi:MAG: hypothetical protein WDO74_15090 [Pseudomonadota bacterium]